MAIRKSLRKVTETFNSQAHALLVEKGMTSVFQVTESGDGVAEVISGTRCLNFCSNDYLGLRRDPRMLRAARDAVAEFGTGTASSRLMCGSIPLHRKLEERLADWLGQADALVFATGYDANLGTISALLDKSAVAICDGGVHASIIDGCRLAGAKIRRFRSSEPGQLAGVLRRFADRDRLVLMESIYSMEGTVLPLDEILQSDIPDDVGVYLDESHSIGLVGRDGSGMCRQSAYGERVDLIMGTLSKAFASCGGFVAGDADLIRALRVNARSLMFTAGAAPATLGAALCALDIIQDEHERRQKIRRLSTSLRDGFVQAGFDVGPARSQIVPVYIGDPWRTAEFAHRLHQIGINAGVAVHPAVPPSKSLLRFCVTARHEDSHIQECIEKVAAVWSELNRQPALA
jgi:8-amino-7-oxononanoate synthase